MNINADVQNSKLVRTLKQEAPVLRASKLGDESLISFISLQATLPSRAAIVVSSLEGEIKKGYRLDSVLDGILRKAKNTVRRNKRYGIH